MKKIQFLKRFENIISPPVCLICGERLSFNEETLCLYCLNDLPLTFFWDWQDNPAEERLWGRTRLEWVTSLFFFRKDSRYIEMIHRIKYCGDKNLGYRLGVMLGKEISESNRLQEIDYIVPVPVHWFKKFRRGYNQAECIAEGISEALCKPIIPDMLLRKGYSRSQTSVAINTKWDNIKNDFSLNYGRLEKIGLITLKDKHILLVDDVLTTGSTVEACYLSLSGINDLKVSVATLAFVE